MSIVLFLKIYAVTKCMKNAVENQVPRASNVLIVISRKRRRFVHVYDLIGAAPVRRRRSVVG